MTQTFRHAHFKTVVRRATFGFHLDTGVRRYSENRKSQSDVCNCVGRNSSYGIFCRGGQSLVEGALPDQMRSVSANVSDFEQPALRGLSLQIERVLLNDCRPKIGRNGVHSCGGGRRICRKHGERLWRWKWLRERCLESGVCVCQAGGQSEHRKRSTKYVLVERLTCWPRIVDTIAAP